MSVQEFRRAIRTAGFWSIVLRHALPVVGVTAWGWSGATIAIFFVLESWLFLATRSAVEITFDAGFAFDRRSRTRRQTLLALARNVLISAVMFGILVFGFGGVIALVAFSGGEGERFLREGWTQTSFLFGLVGLVAAAIVDGVAFTQRLDDRTPAEQAEDDARIRVMFYRNIGLLLGGTLIIAVASAFDVGAVAVVVAISVTLMWIEFQGRLVAPS